MRSVEALPSSTFALIYGVVRSCVVHPLIAAPSFVGRQAEYAQLESALLDDASPYCAVSLVAIGGAGKTALAAEFLRRLPQQARKPEFLFVWSFYVDQDPNSFLTELTGFVSDIISSTRRHATGLAGLSSLCEWIAKVPGRILIVLDGLERVQTIHDEKRRARGSIEDTLLRRTIMRLAGGIPNVELLITTRVEPSDLLPWSRRHLSLHISELDHEAARDLLVRRGVKVGDDGQLARLFDEFGSHALTLEHLGGYLAKFREGNLHALPAPLKDIDTHITEQRLLRVLTALAAEMDSVDLALVQRLCLYRFGATAVTLFNTFAQVSAEDIAGALYCIERADLDAALDRLVEFRLVYREGDGTFTTHPAIRDFFYGQITNHASLHAAVLSNMGINLAWDELESIVQDYQFADEQDELDENERWECANAVRQFIRDHEASLGDAVAVFHDLADRMAAGRPVVMPRRPSAGISLTERPGKEAPSDAKTLNFLEELIYHSLEANDVSGAMHLYHHRLGGREHLGKALGESARGERVVSAILGKFSPYEIEEAKENDGPWNLKLHLAWYRRGLGELESSFDLFKQTRPMWAGVVRVLQGRLVEGSAEGYWTATRDCSKLMRGLRPRGYRPIWVGFGEVIVDGDVALMFDLRDEAMKLDAVGVNQRAENVRVSMVRAEVHRRNRKYKQARTHMHDIEPWIYNSGSPELLAQLLMLRMRVAEDQSQQHDADVAFDECSHLVHRCGLGLYRIDLLTQRASALVDRYVNTMDGDLLDVARRLADAALRGALQPDAESDGEYPIPDEADLPLESLLALGAEHPMCDYTWGQAAAHVVLGRVAIHQKRTADAVKTLQRAYTLYDHLGAPKAKATEQLLRKAARS